MPIYFVLNSTGGWESVSVHPDQEDDFIQLNWIAHLKGKKGITRDEWYSHMCPTCSCRAKSS